MYIKYVEVSETDIISRFQGYKSVIKVIQSLVLYYYFHYTVARSLEA